MTITRIADNFLSMGDATAVLRLITAAVLLAGALVGLARRVVEFVRSLQSARHSAKRRARDLAKTTKPKKGRKAARGGETKTAGDSSESDEPHSGTSERRAA